MDDANKGVVVFDPNEFRQVYPAFASMTDAQLEFNFNMAEIILNNTPCSIVRNLKERKLLLYLLVAHLCALYMRDNAPGNSGSGGLVGRIDSATTGSASVHSDMPDMHQDAAWYMQTSYGATFWNMTMKFRSFRTVAGNAPSLTPSHYFRRYGRNYVPRV